MPTSLSWLRTEIQQRMLDKLAPIKLNPKRILLEPDFDGLNRNAFAKRFDCNDIDILIDSQSNEPLGSSLSWKRFIRNLVPRSGRVLEQDLLGNASYDLILSNLRLQNFTNPSAWLAKSHERLSAGGLVSFSYLGPDTGKEIRAADSGTHYLQNLPGAQDMHDIGDALVQNRFSDPVMDMEYLFLEYETERALYEDVRALKLIAPDTPFPEFRAPAPLKITLEIVYGHAWVLAKNLSVGDGKNAYIRLDAIKRK